MHWCVLVRHAGRYLSVFFNERLQPSLVWTQATWLRRHTCSSPAEGLPGGHRLNVSDVRHPQVAGWHVTLVVCRPRTVIFMKNDGGQFFHLLSSDQISSHRINREVRCPTAACLPLALLLPARQTSGIMPLPAWGKDAKISDWRRQTGWVPMGGTKNPTTTSIWSSAR